MSDVARTAEYDRFYSLPSTGMAVVSASTRRCLRVNDALCGLLGYTREELLERSFADFTHPDDVATDVAAFDAVARGDREGYRKDKRFIAKGGRVVHAMIDLMAERRPDGHVDHCYVTVADVTSRQETEEALRAGSALFEDLARQVPGALYQFRRHPDGRMSFPFASDALREVLEVGPAEVSRDATPAFARVHTEDLTALLASIDESARTLDPWHAQFRVQLPAGGLRWLSGSARPQRLPDGGTLWHGFLTDVTESRAAHARLQESEERFRVQIEHAPEAIVVFDIDSGRFTDANQNALGLFALDRETLLQRGPIDVSPEVQPNGRPSAEMAMERIGAALQGEVPVFEWVHRSSTGKDIPCEIRLVRLPSGTRRLVRGSISDITDRNRAKAELLRLDAAIAASINGIAIADLEGRLTYVNAALLALLGFTDPSEMLGRFAGEFWESGVQADEVWRRLLARGTDRGEMRAPRVDGTTGTFQYTTNLFHGADGAPAGMIASFVDVTASRLAEADLRLRDQAIATSLNAIAIADPDGALVHVNPAFARMWGGASAAEMVGQPTFGFAGSAAMQGIIAELRANGVFQGEFQGTRADGSRFNVEIAANAVRDDAGRLEHLMASFHDVTESKRLQEQFLQSQKMESVGRLAGGVAHDFNNLLTVMKGYLDLVRIQVPHGDAIAADLAEIDRAVESAASLTGQLLAFSRKQVVSPQVLDLNASVARMHTLLSRLLGEDIDLRQVTAPDLGLVRFDPTQAEQILVNLAVNVRDAMPDGGHLTLETANVTLDAAYARAHPGMEPGEYVMLAVTDTGTGMEPEVQALIFEPFFTTKAVGIGTGLGLSMVFGAVTQHGGRIEVDSAIGKGTTFRIHLPRVNAESSPRLTPTTGALPHGTETIALVEDEEAIRALAVRVLVGLGYAVLPFRSGTAALAGLEGALDQVDLLLTDVVMPGMSGRQLADRLRAMRPDLRVLFASGYTEDVIGQHGVLEDGADLLPKPYSTSALARRVRAALDREPSR